jgi:hypothetical protein
MGTSEGKSGRARTGTIPIISDDGEFLILLQTSDFDWAMRVYRRRQGHKGILVKDIPLKDIWPENKWREWERRL